MAPIAHVLSPGEQRGRADDQPVYAIEVRDLHKTYRERVFKRKDVLALRGVSFSVPVGEIFGLLGPNGAGKTTLIKILLGIVRGSSGQALLLGRPPGERSARRRVGYLPENLRVPRHHTGRTALEFYGGLSGLSAAEIHRRQPEVLSLVGMERWADTPVRKYSKGMQQRLGMAQALLHEPELLILDEPTDGVDPVGRSEMRALLVRLKAAGKTIFLNSHHLQEIELVCDRVAILDRGRLRRESRISDLTIPRQTDLFLTLLGPEATIQQALGGRDVLGWVGGDGEQQVTVRVSDQSDIDRLIDELRAAGVGIADLRRHRPSLEEAFLAVLAESAADPAVPLSPDADPA